MPEYTLATMDDAERQLAHEGAQRTRIAVLAIVAGIALFAGELWSAVIEAKEPTVGLLQGLAPAMKGLAAAPIDPRSAHERFLVNHQLPLIIALLVSSLGALAIIFPLRYLADAERVRSPNPSVVTRYLAFGPILIAIFVPVYEISLIIGAHHYLSGTARTAAAYTAATGGGVRTALVLLVTIGQLTVAAAFVLISLRSMRVGLLTRMMGGVGIVGGVLFVIPLTPLPVVQALWLVFLGATLLGFGGRPLPEAWTVAEARPWPSAPPRAQPSDAARRRGPRAPRRRLPRRPSRSPWSNADPRRRQARSASAAGRRFCAGRSGRPPWQRGTRRSERSSTARSQVDRAAVPAAPMRGWLT